VLVDCNTLQRKEADNLSTNDVLGDASAAPFAGPAIDVEPFVFRMRLLPLAVGYKTTLTTLPFLIGYGVAKPVELAVTAVEPVQTVAGKFNCYKISIAPLGQTFWIGVDGARPLVKFLSGNVQAELVKVWGPSVIGDSLAFLTKAGWTVSNIQMSPNFGSGGEAGAASAEAASPREGPYGWPRVSISIKRIYTPPEDLEATVQKFCADAKTIPAQTRTVAGHPTVGCQKDKGNSYSIWVASDSIILQFYSNQDPAVFRWMFEPILDTIQLPRD
jgi:hypothetical protein